MALGWLGRPLIIHRQTTQHLTKMTEHAVHIRTLSKQDPSGSTNILGVSAWFCAGLVEDRDSHRYCEILWFCFWDDFRS